MIGMVLSRCGIRRRRPAASRWPSPRVAPRGHILRWPASCRLAPARGRTSSRSRNALRATRHKTRGKRRQDRSTTRIPGAMNWRASRPGCAPNCAALSAGRYGVDPPRTRTPITAAGRLGLLSAAADRLLRGRPTWTMRGLSSHARSSDWRTPNRPALSAPIQHAVRKRREQSAPLN